MGLREGLSTGVETLRLPANENPSIKKPFIVKTPFVEPHEKEGDIWKGLVAFVKEILRKQ